MKIFNYLILASLFMASCQSEPSKNTAAVDEVENMDHEKTLVLPWKVQLNESTQAMEIKKDPAANMANLQPADIVDAINIKYPEIKLEWVKLEGDKAVVNNANATFLTQRSGTQGARAYLAEATYALTELKSIAAVQFIFTEGDHARPGVYKRVDFGF